MYVVAESFGLADLGSAMLLKLDPGKSFLCLSKEVGLLHLASKLCLHFMIAAALIFSGTLMAETTLGEPSCAQWLKRSAKSESDRAWLLGFMSGLNLADSKEEDHQARSLAQKRSFSGSPSGVEQARIKKYLKLALSFISKYYAVSSSPKWFSRALI
ncbi:MAG: hypothetical protein RIT13_1323 [Pseudomonadota bacterium]